MLDGRVSSCTTSISARSSIASTNASSCTASLSTPVLTVRFSHALVVFGFPVDSGALKLSHVHLVSSQFPVFL